MKIWILFLCAVAVGISAQSDESADADLDWDDGWKEYDDDWFRERLAELGIYNEEQNYSPDSGDADVGLLEKDQDEMDKKVEEDMEMDKKVEEDIRKFQEVEDEDKIDDYQFEDNRSEQSDKLGDENKAEPIHDIDDGNNQDSSLSVNENDYDYYALNIDDALEPNNLPEYGDVEVAGPKFSKDDDTLPLPSPESSDEIERILIETQAIINEEEQKPNDFEVHETEQGNSNEVNAISEETNAILEKNLLPNDFAEDENKSEALEESQNVFAAGNEIVDDDEKVFDSNQVDTVIAKKDIKAAISDEDTVNNVYEDLNADLDKLFETLDQLAKSENEEEKLKPADVDVDYAVNSDESLDDKPNYDNILDSNLSDIFAEHSAVLDNEKIKEFKVDDEAKETKTDEEPTNDTNETKESKEQVLEEVPYINDALLSDDKNEEAPIKTVDVDKLSDDQLIQLMKDFEIQHSDVFDVESLSDDHVVNEISLEYGETKIITSDNYPAGYPTNRVVDWIITGKGQGIELNVTDFAVNSAIGDYLMVKPGQADDSGAEGIIFSYHLNEPRAFRFTDVDRIFIRFDAKEGWSFLRGFSLTLKVIAPPVKDTEPEPEAEPLLPEPRHTLTVMLGGMTLARFQEVSDQFRRLVADMATMYINSNSIEPGMNTTLEITQLVSASICNVQWPGYEQCSQVKFSVPLVYEDDDEEPRLHEADLQTMWDTYVEMDPFAARLRQMGIEEFSVPNDGGVLTVWVVVALGVVVSAAMLAIALWRYSCFEDYSRMPAYSDTDSLHGKDNSALYPTPHQMLPPLYAEKDYDSTRVDMGGFTNRSYTRTDMYDLDSDEDVLPQPNSHSNAGIQPKDVVSV